MCRPPGIQANARLRTARWSVPAPFVGCVFKLPLAYARDCSRLLAYRLVALVKSLLSKGSTTDFQVRQWGIRRTWKSVVPLRQQAVTRRVFKLPPKSGLSKNSQPIREALLGNVYHVSWTAIVPTLVLYSILVEFIEF